MGPQLARGAHSTKPCFLYKPVPTVLAAANTGCKSISASAERHAASATRPLTGTRFEADGQVLAVGVGQDGLEQGLPEPAALTFRHDGQNLKICAQARIE